MKRPLVPYPKLYNVEEYYREIDYEIIKFTFILAKMGKDCHQQSMPMFSLPRSLGAIVPSGPEPTHN